MSVKANEREFMSQVTSWLNEKISNGTYPFEVASSEASIRITEKTTNFPDVQIWLNRRSGLGFCGWELKTPLTHVDDATLLEDAARKARAMSANYFITWNMRDAIIWRTPNTTEPVSREHRLETFKSIPAITKAEDLWVPSKQVLLKARARELLDALATLQRDGHLHLIDTDSTFFVHILTGAAKTLTPHIYQSIIDQIGSNKQFKEGLFDWAVKQAIANYDDPEFFETVSRQYVYRVIGKILFYLTLRNFRPDLPEFNLNEINPKTVDKKLKEFFELARQIDYQAIFEEDFLDNIKIPASGVETLRLLIEDLNRFSFSQMPHDVMGNVFEKLIPPEDRHLLGQYFTKEDLVDLINAFCIHTKDSKVIDPTCGTGTFLIRAYNRLNILGEKSHTNLLSNLWGFDIAHFPAELATINLYRQNLSDYRNFPRIISKDFFEVQNGDTFKFPPPKATNDKDFMIEEKLPVFDAAVGNFPYIRQELIEKRIFGYKNSLANILSRDWALDYPELFDKKGNLKLSGQADIYSYLFFHTARLLREDGGRMGIVTSNSWLDVAYGYELQKFFLKNFKIIAILESRCEPWFEDAAINTVVTILERTPSNEEAKKVRNDHLVKFVKIKKRLQDIMPWDMKMEATRRWTGLDGIVRQIENAGSAHFKIAKKSVENTCEGLGTFENDNFRVRFIKQKNLLNELESTRKTVKWGRYLRAPNVYFEIIDGCKNKLVPLKDIAEVRFGIKAGINEFFYLDNDKIKHWGIEDEFLAPVIKSPKESKGILIDSDGLSTKVFLCQRDKTQLRKEGKTGALKYIEWGEKQATKDNILWPDTPSVKNRNPGWWSLPDANLVQIFWTKSYDVKFLQRYSPEKLLADQRLYTVVEKKNINTKLLASLMNCTLFFLFIELNGRINLGEGALDTTVEEVQDYVLIPDPGVFTQPQIKNLLRLFDPIISRPTMSIFEEVKMKDRQKLDSLVLEAIGLDPKKYLKPLYDGICELVRERIELAGMRKKEKKAKTQKDVEKVFEQVRDEVLPEGPKRFPEEFIDTKFIKEGRDISVPNEPLRLGDYFMGQQELISENGFKHTAASRDEAKFIIYSQKPNCYISTIPKNKTVMINAVDGYEKYIKKLKDELFKKFFARTHDHKLSETLTIRMIDEFGIKEV